MMSELTRLHDEAERLSVVYKMYKDSEDKSLRRKAHIDLDRFLMHHRELAILLMTEGLQREIDRLVDEHRADKKPSTWRKLLNRLAPGRAPTKET